MASSKWETGRLYNDTQSQKFRKDLHSITNLYQNLWQIMRRITLICDNVLTGLEPAKTDFRRRLAIFCGCPEQIRAWTNERLTSPWVHYLFGPLERRSPAQAGLARASRQDRPTRYGRGACIACCACLSALARNTWSASCFC